MPDFQRIHVIDSHTGGEPTRVVVGGGPDLGSGPLSDRRNIFRERFDGFRRAVITEPRGSDVLVGALLCEPHDPTCDAGVIYFNNAGMIGMCGHGTIGVVVTLAHLGRMKQRSLRLETPVGIVACEFDGANSVTLENVPSYRYAENVTVNVSDVGPVIGDIAWGGNWFFLASDHKQPLALENVDELTAFTKRIRRSLAEQRITGKDGAEIDHIELFGPPRDANNHSRNFVLCPGGAYDRSPCGTGTSAKLACLCADGKISQGDEWRQESIIGSVYITAEATLLVDQRDPLRYGFGESFRRTDYYH